jgi:hypothetical protein
VGVSVRFVDVRAVNVLVSRLPLIGCRTGGFLVRLAAVAAANVVVARRVLIVAQIFVILFINVLKAWNKATVQSAEQDDGRIKL